MVSRPAERFRRAQARKGLVCSGVSRAENYGLPSQGLLNGTRTPGQMGGSQPPRQATWTAILNQARWISGTHSPGRRGENKGQASPRRRGGV